MNHFIIKNPELLWLYALLVALVVVTIIKKYKKCKTLQKLGHSQAKLTKNLLQKLGSFLALGLLIFAISRPCSNPEEKSTSNSSRDVIILFDVSQSMLAEDVYPSRLELAKIYVSDFINFNHNDRVAVVTFAGSASLICPLTKDRQFIQTVLKRIGPYNVDIGGTSLDIALEKSLDKLFADSRKGYQDIIILTDGGNHSPLNQVTVENINKSGANIFIMGIGDPDQGAKIPLGDGKFLKYKEKEVTTKLDEEATNAILQTCPRAKYLRTDRAGFHLGAIYDDLSQDLPRQSLGDEKKIEYHELYPYFIGLALLIFLCQHLLKLAHSRWFVLLLIINFANADEIENLTFELEKETLSPAERAVITYNLGCHFIDAKRYTDALDSFSNIDGDKLPRKQDLQLNLAICFKELAKQTESKNLTEAINYLNSSRQQTLKVLRQNFKQQTALKLLTFLNKEQELLIVKLKAEQELKKKQIAELNEVIALLKKNTEEQKKLYDIFLKLVQELRRYRRQPIPKELDNRVIATYKKEEPNQNLACQGTKEIDKKLLPHVEHGRKMFELLADNGVVKPGDSTSPKLEKAYKAIQQVVKFQGQAEVKLNKLENIYPLFDLLNEAYGNLNYALNLLEGDAKDKQSASESEMDEEDFELYEQEQSDSAQSALNMKVEGDFNVDLQNQQLSPPKISVEEILQEEMDNQKQRQRNARDQNSNSDLKDW